VIAVKLGARNNPRIANRASFHNPVISSHRERPVGSQRSKANITRPAGAHVVHELTPDRQSKSLSPRRDFGSVNGHEPGSVYLPESGLIPP
jgi:hypothetical protein